MTDEQRKCPECGGELATESPDGLCAKCLLRAGFSSRVSTDSLPDTTAYAARADAPTPAELNEKFPELEVLEPLGQGGMGVVYKARQRRLDRLVALKILRSDLAADPDFAERFTREARALGRLKHQAVVGVHDFGLVDDLYFFIMEFVDGTNLRSLVKSGDMQPAEALAIVPKLCDALQYAHDQGIVHRDIKPENILVDRNGDVKIADFGLAKLINPDSLDFTLTGTRQVMGTPMYMAPEQLERPLEVDHRADIYSLGVVFYEMLTGELPLGRFAKPSEKVQVDVRLDEVVLRALEKEPNLRYQNISEVKTEVQNFHSSVSADAAAEKSVASTASHIGPWYTDSRIPAFGLMLCGVIAVIDFPNVLRNASRYNAGQGAIATILLLPSVFAAVGGWHLLKRKSASIAVVGAMAGLLPFHLAALVAIPSAVWALLLLFRTDLKSKFETPQQTAAGPRDIADRVLQTGEDAIDASVDLASKSISGAVGLVQKPEVKGHMQAAATAAARQLKNAWSALRAVPLRRTLRRLTFAAVWTAMVLAAALAVFYLKVQPQVMSRYGITQSVTVAPRMGQYTELRIRATGSGEKLGGEFTDNLPFTSADLRIRSGPREERISLRFEDTDVVYHTYNNTADVTTKHSWQSKQQVADWMTRFIGDDFVDAQIARDQGTDHDKLLVKQRIEIEKQATDVLRVLTKLGYRGAFDPPEKTIGLAQYFDHDIFRVINQPVPYVSVSPKQSTVAWMVAATLCVLLPGYFLMFWWWRQSNRNEMNHNNTHRSGDTQTVEATA